MYSCSNLDHNCYCSSRDNDYGIHDVHNDHDYANMNDDCNKKGNKSYNMVNNNCSKGSNNTESPNHIHSKYCYPNKMGLGYTNNSLCNIQNKNRNLTSLVCGIF